MARLTSGWIICLHTPMRKKIPNLFHNGCLNLATAYVKLHHRIMGNFFIIIIIKMITKHFHDPDSLMSVRQHLQTQINVFMVTLQKHTSYPPPTSRKWNTAPRPTPLEQTQLLQRNCPTSFDRERLPAAGPSRPRWPQSPGEGERGKEVGGAPLPFSVHLWTRMTTFKKDKTSLRE